MACEGCRYVPWPCASCGVPRCYCRDGDVYRHHRPQEPQIALPATHTVHVFPCGHEKREWNLMLQHGRFRCRECVNRYNREYRRNHGLPLKARHVSGEQLGRDYLESRE